VSTWAGIRDTLWPLIVHQDGDEAWAHLEADRLPGASATWCNPLQNDQAALTAGRTIYLASCASCHGDLGKGDGPGAGLQEPRPYDFTRPEFAGMREAPGAAVLYAIVVRGIEGTDMRGVGPDMGWWERLAVMAYITSLPGRDAIGGSRAWADTLRTRRQAGRVR
jgi:mono/diheme cytochrome c family protein